MNNERYWQMEFIAPGGSSDVYRAVDSWTGRIVAIKVLRNPTPDKIRRLQRESAMLTIHLHNPFVVDILDSDLDSAAPYLVLEYSELGSLQECVANPRDWWTIARWLYDIAYGLTIVHERGGFIRDIKPSNLLRFRDANGSGRIKTADFGLGQRPGSHSGPMTTSPFGTEGYIDPVAQITQKFTPASDIYSLGITTRELLTGSRDLRNLIPGPPDFQTLIASMTAFNPFMKDFNVNSRPTARQVLHEIQSILQTAEAPAAPEFGGKGLWWGLGIAALAIVTNSITWDSYAERYRDSRGRFRSGWLS